MTPAVILLLLLPATGWQGAAFRSATTEAAKSTPSSLTVTTGWSRTSTREDFDVRDNGKPAELSVFSADPAPITSA